MTRCYELLSFGFSCLAAALVTIGTIAVPAEKIRAAEAAGCPEGCTCSVLPCSDDICSGVDGCPRLCDCVKEGVSDCKCQ